MRAALTRDEQPSASATCPAAMRCAGSTGAHRKLRRKLVENHSVPLEILDEFRAVEREMLAEIDQLADAVREAVGE